MNSVTATDCVASADPRYWDCPTLDTDGHILASLGQPLSLPDSVDPDSWDFDNEPALLRWFARLTHNEYEQKVRDNTYNSENDFSSNFIFSVYAPVDCIEWYYHDDVFIVIECHLGGDVRGNYGPLSVFRVDHVAESGFLDWVVGWYATPIKTEADTYLEDCEHLELEVVNDRLSVGYSSHPTSELRNILKRDPVWSNKLGCYVGSLENVPFAVRLQPSEPCYY